MRRKHHRLEHFVILLATLLFVFGSCLSCIKNTRYTTLDITNFGNPSKPVYFSSVVRVMSDPVNPLDKTLFGTAFAVTPDLMFTAGHLCKSAQARIDAGQDHEVMKWDFVDEKGQISEGYEDVKILAIHDSKDVCLLKSEDHGLIPLRLSQRVDLMITGDMLIVAGYPHGIPYLVQKEGSMIAIDDQSLYADLFIEPGNSGSPVIWMDEVVGMIIVYPVSDSTLITQTSKAVSVKELQKFLNEHIGE